MNQNKTIHTMVKYSAAAVMMLGATSVFAAGVSFIEPLDGAKIGQDVHIVMAVEGMSVRKAGDVIKKTGHHHLVIDGGFIPKGEAVVKDATHKHFGKGQTETMLHLTPGKHTLTLQFADGHHQSYGKKMSQTIHIFVK